MKDIRKSALFTEQVETIFRGSGWNVFEIRTLDNNKKTAHVNLYKMTGSTSKEVTFHYLENYCDDYNNRTDGLFNTGISIWQDLETRINQINK